MTLKELERKAQELQELKRMREELDGEIETLTDSIKAGMGDRETITAGAYKIAWKSIESIRIDTAALKKELPEIAARFSKTSTIRRFTVA